MIKYFEKITINEGNKSWTMKIITNIICIIFIELIQMKYMAIKDIMSI